MLTWWTIVAVIVLIATSAAVGCASSTPRAQEPTTPSPRAMTGPNAGPSAPAGTGGNRAPSPSAEPVVDAQKQSPTTAETAAIELANAIWGFYWDKETFELEFEQRYQGKVGWPKGATGTVAAKRPDTFVFRYETSGNVVVSDGKLVQVYERSQAKVYEQPVRKSQYTAALAFLMGNLRLEFRLRMLDAEKIGYEEGTVILAVPNKPTPAYEKMLVYVEHPTHEVRRVVLIDERGNRNRFDFTDLAYDTDIPDAAFTLEVPEGTEEVRVP